VPGDEIMLRT
jgi:integrase